jgi:HAD superfamily hydrolase (TIGR01509 family)
LHVVTTPHPAAVLWDMDGTLVDTEPYWMRAQSELVQSFGGTWTDEDALPLVGSGLWNGARVLQSFGVRMGADEIVQQLTERVREQLAESGVPWQPGAQELLAEVRRLGIRTALVTMSIRSMADDIVRAIPFDAFDAVVTGDSVDNPKPHPEPYLRATTALGARPETCVAIEDSPIGIAAAAAAGAITIGVPHMVALDEAPADVLWPSLAGRTVADLGRVLAAGRMVEGGVA